MSEMLESLKDDILYHVNRVIKDSFERVEEPDLDIDELKRKLEDLDNALEDLERYIPDTDDLRDMISCIDHAYAKVSYIEGILSELRGQLGN